MIERQALAYRHFIKRTLERHIASLGYLEGFGSVRELRDLQSACRLVVGSEPNPRSTKRLPISRCLDRQAAWLVEVQLMDDWV